MSQKKSKNDDILLFEKILNVFKEINKNLAEFSIPETLFFQGSSINVYLTSKGIRTGTFVELYSLKIYEKLKSEENYVRFINKSFTSILDIDNIGFIVGSFYDNSYKKDTVYVYNKKLVSSVKKDIKFLEDTSINNINKDILDPILLKRHKKIAKLLSYDVIDYKDFILGTAILYDLNYIIYFKEKMVGAIPYMSYLKNKKHIEKLNKITNAIYGLGMEWKCELKINIKKFL